MVKTGKIIIPPKAYPWNHETEVARVLADAGHIVEFIVKDERKKVHSADIILDDKEIWEMKAPDGKSLDSVERNLRRGSHQSPNIIFTSWRMKYIPDIAIERELHSQSSKISKLKKLKFVNRKKQIIDIK